MNLINESPSAPPVVQSSNPQMPIAFSTMIAVSWVLLVLVGGGLFCFPAFARAHWLWRLSPFNTRFLGAIYLSALAPLSVMLWVRRWRPARLVLPMLWVSTTVILVASFLHGDRFTFSRRATGIWYWLYLADCLGATYFLGRFSKGRTPLKAKHMPTHVTRLSGGWAHLLRLQTWGLGLFGLGLLFLPVWFGTLWLWPLDAFHSQLYSAVFLAGAIGTAILRRVASSVDLLTLGMTQVTFSILVITGVIIVDGALQKINWLGPMTWVWMGGFIGLGCIGLLLLQKAWTLHRLPDDRC